MNIEIVGYEDIIFNINPRPVVAWIPLIFVENLSPNLKFLRLLNELYLRYMKVTERNSGE